MTVARPPEDGQHRSAQREGLRSRVARPPEDGQHRSAQGQGGPQTEHASAREVLVLLDDAAAGASLLVLSSALAQVLKRDLDLVFVENSRSLAAAALPFTQVLPHAGTGWVPLSPQDIEQGFRAHAARLQDERVKECGEARRGLRGRGRVRARAREQAARVPRPERTTSQKPVTDVLLKWYCAIKSATATAESAAKTFARKA